MVPRNLETPSRARRDEAESSFGAIDRGVDRDVVPDEIRHFDGDLRVGRGALPSGAGAHRCTASAYQYRYSEQRASCDDPFLWGKHDRILSPTDREQG